MFWLIVFLLLSVPSLALAYIDPTILGGLYQLVYASVFGILAFLIFKPWAFIKSKLVRLFGTEKNREKLQDRDSE